MRISSLRGFTLMELLVVLAISGLLLAAIPPMISSAMPGAELKSAARELSVALRKARLNAISHGIPVEVTFAGDPARYAIGDAAPHSLPRKTEMRVSRPASSTGDAPHFTSIPDEPFRLRFLPDGSSGGATVLLSRDGGNYAINVGWLMGRVSVTQQAFHVH